MMCICDVLLNPKYTGHVYKVTVAVGNLGNIVWICVLMPGKSGGCYDFGINVVLHECTDSSLIMK